MSHSISVSLNTKIEVVLNLEGVKKLYTLAEQDKIECVVTLYNICANAVPISIYFLSTNSK
jgi:hypothetical protein